MEPVPFKVRAGRMRRLFAGIIDAFFVLFVLIGLSTLLPNRPPVDAMAFYSGQDFINYFVLAGCGVVLSYTYTYFAFSTGIGGTLGTMLMRLKLVCLNDGAPTHNALSIRPRAKRAALIALLIFIPGPILALFVAAIGSSILGSAFMTADAALVQLGINERLTWLIHSMSFILLIAAFLWTIVPQKSFARRGNLTPLDERTQTVFARNK
ncbi:MAG: RDD family protein [Pseudomonadota bacterium]